MGLSWYRARWYDPETGRFVSEDPIGFSAGDTNLNRYVGNGPVNGTDPSGLDDNEIDSRPFPAPWKPSALLQLNFRVDRLEFRASVVDLHLPFDAALSGVYVFMPSSGLLAKFVFTANPTATHALTRETT